MSVDQPPPPPPTDSGGDQGDLSRPSDGDLSDQSDGDLSEADDSDLSDETESDLSEAEGDLSESEGDLSEEAEGDLSETGDGDLLEQTDGDLSEADSEEGSPDNSAEGSDQQEELDGDLSETGEGDLSNEDSELPDTDGLDDRSEAQGLGDEEVDPPATQDDVEDVPVDDDIGVDDRLDQADNAVPGDVEFTQPNDQFALNAANRPDVDPGGCCDVIAHGNASQIQVETPNGPQLVDHRVASRLIDTQPDYTRGQDIRLLSCSTGADSDGFAQNLSNKMGVNVEAPTDTLWAHADGSMTIGPTPVANTGKWEIFSPRKSP